MIVLKNRAHLFTHPKNKEAFDTQGEDSRSRYRLFDYREGFFYFQMPGGQVIRFKLP